MTTSTLIAAIHELRGRELSINTVRGTRARWQQLAVTNAEQALNARLANRQHVVARFDALAEVLNLDEPPQRLEWLRHQPLQRRGNGRVLRGTGPKVRSNPTTVANIEGVTAGATTRRCTRRWSSGRFSKLKDGEGKLPDILPDGVPVVHGP